MGRNKRFAGAVVFALSLAYMAEALVLAGVTVWNYGHFPKRLDTVLALWLIPLGVMVFGAYRYWTTTEFDPEKALRWPVLTAVLALLVVGVAGVFVERPAGIEVRREAPAETPAPGPPVLPGSGERVGSYSDRSRHLLGAGGLLSRNSAAKQISGPDGTKVDK